MLSKKKTFLALTVKLIFSVSLIHAQTANDSATKNVSYYLSLTNRNLVLKQDSVSNKLPGNFYAKQLPFFCAKELQVQKAVGIPIKFRLSTVEYCDKLEGKNQ